MSQYNKTVLTHPGLELAKRANAGQAKFGITRAVTSADDWSHKTVQDLEEVTTIPNIMQQGTIMDTDEVESNNSVIGVSLCFTNKNLSTGYQIRIIGLYVKEEGQENDFLYAVTTAITPEYMPSFADKVLYRFNTQMYLVIGNAQSVNVVINDGTAVTHGQLDKYKAEVTENLKKLENTHKEDMSHVVKSASINGGSEVLPDETGKLELVVPDPDLSKYVSLEQLTETLKSKADITAVPDKTATEEGIKQAKQMAQEADTKAQNALDNKADKTTVEENLATKANASDLSALQNSAMQVIDGNSGDDILSFRDEKIRCYNNAQNVQNLPDMSNKTWFYVITHTKKGWGSVTVISQDNYYWQNVLNGNNWSGWVKYATNVDITNLQNKINSKTSGTIVTAYDIANKNPTKETNSYTNKWLVDQNVLGQFADQINQLKGRQTLDSPDFNSITNTGVYYITNNNAANMKNNPVYTSGVPVSQWGVLVVSSGKGQRTSQVYYPDNNVSPFCRVGTGSTWQSWYELSTQNDISNLQNAVNSKADKSQVNVGGSLFRMLSAGDTWNDILGFDNGGAPALVAFRGNTGGAMNNLLGNYSAGVAFGGGDTKGFLEVSYGDHNARIGGGNGSAPVWHEDIAWKSDITNLQNKLAQYTVDYNNNYVHDTTIDFNSYLHETRTIKVANVKANNGPLANTATIWGWLTTYHWDDNSVTQEYRDAGGEVFWRATSASASRQWTWHKYAKQEDIDNQQRQINDLINNINYIKDNYVEGRRFPASQEAQAEAWENENPQRIAFITK